MISKKIYIEQLIDMFANDGLFDMSSDDYISKEVFSKRALKFIDDNQKYGMDCELSEKQIQIILEESRIETIKNTITFLSEKNILIPTAINKATGEFIYTLTEEGKTLYKKLFTE